MTYSFWKRLAILFVIYGIFGWILEFYFQYLYLLVNGHFFWIYPSSPASATLPIVFFLWGPSSLAAVMGYRWMQKQPAYLAATPGRQFVAVTVVLGIGATIAEFTIASVLRLATGSNFWIYVDSPIPETTPWMPPLWAIMGIIMVGMYIEAKSRLFPKLRV